MGSIPSRLALIPLREGAEALPYGIVFCLFVGGGACRRPIKPITSYLLPQFRSRGVASPFGFDCGLRPALRMTFLGIALDGGHLAPSLRELAPMATEGVKTQLINNTYIRHLLLPPQAVPLPRGGRQGSSIRRPLRYDL